MTQFPVLNATELIEAEAILKALQGNNPAFVDLEARAKRLHTAINGVESIPIVSGSVVHELNQFLTTAGVGDKVFDVITGPVAQAVSAIPVFGWIFGAVAAAARPIKAAVDSATGHDPTGQKALDDAAAKIAASKKRAADIAKKKKQKQQNLVALKIIKEEERILAEEQRYLETQSRLAAEAKKVADEALEDQRFEHTRNLALLAGAGLTALLAILYGLAKMQKNP